MSTPHCDNADDNAISFANIHKCIVTTATTMSDKPCPTTSSNRNCSQLLSIIEDPQLRVQYNLGARLLTAVLRADTLVGSAA